MPRSLFRICFYSCIMVLVLVSCQKEPGNKDRLTFERSAVEIGFLAAETEVAYTATAPVVLSGTLPDWLTLRIGQKSLTLAVTANPGKELRSFEIRLECGDTYGVLPVQQNADPEGHPQRTFDSLALAEFYHTCGGSTWEPVLTELTGRTFETWNLGVPFSRWEGVRTAVIGGQLRVIGLNLLMLTIDSELPDVLGTLSELTELAISGSGLTGNPLEWIVRLPNIQTIDLAMNDLSGEIPAGFGDLKNLIYLDLSGTGFSGALPEQIGSLTGLLALHWTNNGATGTIPAGYQNLTRLRVLDLSGNELSGVFPEGLTYMADLRELNLSHNRFSGAVPGRISALAHLEMLNLAGNRFSGAIPEGIGWISTLQALLLAGNGPYEGGNTFTGVLPDNFADLAELKTLNISGNRLTGLGKRFGEKNRNLTELNMSFNQITTVPESFARLTALQTFNMNNNRIEHLPSFAALADLQTLMADNNVLTALPDGIAGCRKLEFLLARNNRITAVPPGLYDIPGLRMALSGNPIPVD